MSKTKAQKYILQELATLNEIIDTKIIKGQNYRQEAIRHRTLLAQMKWLKQDSVISLPWRLFSFK